MENLAERFLAGEAESLAGQELHGSVGQMAQQAPNESVLGAVEGALGSMSSQGFGQSVTQAAEQMPPQQRNQLADTLLQAVSQGGGSPNNVLSQLGIGGSNMGSGELGQLAAHVAENHPGALSSVLGNQINSSGGSGEFLQLLGNPMVRQIGMQLAQKML